MTKILLIIFTLFLVMDSKISFAQNPFAQFAQALQCESWSKAIDKEIQNSNYCEINSDCNVLELGGDYIKFGCYHYINAKIDQEDILKKIKNYHSKCQEIIDLCAETPKPICVNKKCVEQPK